MTRSGQPRTRSATGARCQFPGCTHRASSTVKTAQITINGRPVNVDRLCTEHRTALATRPTPRRAHRTRRPTVTVAYYRCGQCDTLHETYPAAERCSDSHGGGRIETTAPNGELHERHATRPVCLACGMAWPCQDGAR